MNLSLLSNGRYVFSQQPCPVRTEAVSGGKSPGSRGFFVAIREKNQSTAGPGGARTL